MFCRHSPLWRRIVTMPKSVSLGRPTSLYYWSILPFPPLDSSEINSAAPESEDLSFALLLVRGLRDAAAVKHLFRKALTDPSHPQPRVISQ